MSADNEKKYTQKTSMESVNGNGGGNTVDEIDEINAIQNNIRKNLEFFMYILTRKNRLHGRSEPL